MYSDLIFFLKLVLASSLLVCLKFGSCWFVQHILLFIISYFDFQFFFKSKKIAIISFLLLALGLLWFPWFCQWKFRLLIWDSSIFQCKRCAISFSLSSALAVLHLRIKVVNFQIMMPYFYITLVQLIFKFVLKFLDICCVVSKFLEVFFIVFLLSFDSIVFGEHTLWFQFFKNFFWGLFYSPGFSLFLVYVLWTRIKLVFCTSCVDCSIRVNQILLFGSVFKVFYTLSDFMFSSTKFRRRMLMSPVINVYSSISPFSPIHASYFCSFLVWCTYI